MKFVLDVHTHTLISGHAYNTIREMTKAAKAKGLSLLGISDHAPMMPGSGHEYYFSNLKMLDRNDYDLPVLFGSELNICDKNGKLDLPDRILEDLDYGIASLHPPCIDYMNEADSTNAILRAIENPYIEIIGHPDDGRYPLRYDEIAAAAKEHNVLLEVNNSSLSPNGFRLNSRENYLKMLDACKKYNTDIIVNSDAHIDTNIGAHEYALAVLQESAFPEELIVNTSVEQFLSHLRKKSYSYHVHFYSIK